MIVTGKTEVLSQSRIVQHKFHKDWPGIEPRVLATNHLSHFFFFYVLLTVHLIIILVINQLNAQIRVL